MRQEKIITIDNIQYQFNGYELQARIEYEIANKDTNENFWDSLKSETGVSRTTVVGWYSKHMPRYTDDLKAVLNYLPGDWYPILIPISLTPNDDNYSSIVDKIKVINEVRTRLKVKSSFIRTYLILCKEYEISYYVLWRILSGKITPSEILCEDILELLAIIDHNSKFEKKEAICEVEDIRIQEIWRVQRKAYKLKMQQLGVFADFIAQYLEKIKNYSIDWFTLVKILNGLATPTAELYEEMEQLLDIVAKTLMRCIFPLSDKQLGMLGDVSISVNPHIKYKNAIPIIMCRNRNSFYDRYSQYKRLERFADNNEITLNTMYVHYLHDASWYNLKDAFDIVESGGSDVVLMYSEEIFISSELKQRACMYAYSHNIPIVFLSDVYYRN